MFLPPDQRAIPPRWEPPHRREEAKRRTDAATWIIVLIAVMALFAPIGGGSFLALAAMLFGY